MTEIWTCTEVRARLPLYLGGDLESPLAEHVRRHLAGCDACARELEAASASRARVLSLASVDEPMPELWSAIRGELAREGLIGGARAPSSRSPSAALNASRERSRWRWMIPAAAAAAFVAFAWLSRDSADLEREVLPSPGPQLVDDGMREVRRDVQLVDAPGEGPALQRIAPGEKALIDLGETQFLDFPRRGGSRVPYPNQDVWLVSDEVR